MTRRQQDHWLAHPYLASWFLWLIFLILLVALEATLGVSWLLIFPIALNGATFFIFLADKIFASYESRRVPEIVLLMTLALGLLGGFLGMAVFRHKTLKSSFQTWAILILILEVAACILFFGSAIQSFIKEK